MCTHGQTNMTQPCWLFPSSARADRTQVHIRRYMKPWHLWTKKTSGFWLNYSSNPQPSSGNSQPPHFQRGCKMDSNPACIYFYTCMSYVWAPACLRNPSSRGPSYFNMSAEKLKGRRSSNHDLPTNQTSFIWSSNGRHYSKA